MVISHAHPHAQANAAFLDLREATVEVVLPDAPPAGHLEHVLDTLTAERGIATPMHILMPNGVISTLDGWLLIRRQIVRRSQRLVDEEHHDQGAVILGACSIYLTKEANFVVAYSDGTNFNRVFLARNRNALAEEITARCGRLRKGRGTRDGLAPLQAQRAMTSAYTALLHDMPILFTGEATPVVEIFR